MYRESAPPEEATELDLDAPEAPDATSLGCAAASAMAGAAILGSAEVALVAGTGVLGALGQLLRSRWHRRRLQGLRSFVGERVYADGRSFTSLDGQRRVRFSAEDRHPRFESLDPGRGITLSSYTGHERLPRAPDDEIPRALFHAHVHGRCVRQVCFDGRPRELGGHAKAVEVSMIRVHVLERGVCVIRSNEWGGNAGDTWHDTFDAAQRQLRHELGAHVGSLVSGDRESPRDPIDPPWV